MVVASVAVLVSDFFLTKLFLLLPGEQLVARLAGLLS